MRRSYHVCDVCRDRIEGGEPRYLLERRRMNAGCHQPHFLYDLCGLCSSHLSVFLEKELAHVVRGRKEGGSDG